MLPCLTQATTQSELTAPAPDLYVAPVKRPSSSDSLALNSISVGPFTLAAGDLSAHSSVWDYSLPTVHTLFTLQRDEVFCPPAREGGCVGSIANQTASRGWSRLDRSSIDSSKCRVILHATPAGAAHAPSPGEGATLNSVASTPVCRETLLPAPS